MLDGKEWVIWESGKILSNSPLGPSSEPLSAVKAQGGAAVIGNSGFAGSVDAWAEGDGPWACIGCS